MPIQFGQKRMTEQTQPGTSGNLQEQIMEEQHGLRVRRHAGLPADRRGQPVRIDVEQHQVRSSRIKPVGREMYLLRGRKVNETDRLQGVRTVFAATLSMLPVGLGTERDPMSGAPLSPQLARKALLALAIAAALWLLFYALIALKVLDL